MATKKSDVKKTAAKSATVRAAKAATAATKSSAKKRSSASTSPAKKTSGNTSAEKSSAKKATTKVAPLKAVKPAERARSTEKKSEPAEEKTTEKKSAAKKPVQKSPSGKKSIQKNGDASAIEVGALAPSFELLDQSGTKIRSEDLRGTSYVLYFYPKDNTPGCTQEACDFRDHHATFSKKKVKVFGVSGDSEKSHAGFASKYSLPFSLLVDEGNSLASKYGAYGPKKLYGREFFGIIRSTFVVGKDGRIAAAYRGVKVPGHVEKLLEQIA